MFKRKKKRKFKIKIEFTKVMVISVFLMCARWIELSYKLSALGVEQNAEQLSIAIVTIILGTVITYCLKSFGEKNSRNKYSVKEVKEIEYED